MFRDAEIRHILSGASFLARNGIAWREERWPHVAEDAQVHADLSLLYHLEAMT